MSNETTVKPKTIYRQWQGKAYHLNLHPGPFDRCDCAEGEEGNLLENDPLGFSRCDKCGCYILADERLLTLVNRAGIRIVIK